MGRVFRPQGVVMTAGEPPGVRARAVVETRNAILEAAGRLLREPSRPWSMEAVAHAEGVTRVTIYNQFGGRVELIEAVLDQVVARDRMDGLLEGTEALPPRAALRAAVTTTCRFWHAERHLLRRLFGAAWPDSAVARLIARREGWRRDQLQALLARLQGDLVDGVDAERATDVLLALTSFPAYDGLGSLGDEPDLAAGYLVRLAGGLLSAPDPA